MSAYELSANKQRQKPKQIDRLLTPPTVQKINREILSNLLGLGLNEDQARAVIKAAAKGEAGRLTINY